MTLFENIHSALLESTQCHSLRINVVSYIESTLSIVVWGYSCYRCLRVLILSLLESLTENSHSVAI